MVWMSSTLKEKLEIKLFYKGIIMTDAQMQVLIVRGMISLLPQDAQDNIKVISESIRQIVQNGGELGTIALVLVAAESVENE